MDNNDFIIREINMLSTVFQKLLHIYVAASNFEVSEINQDESILLYKSILDTPDNELKPFLTGNKCSAEQLTFVIFLLLESGSSEQENTLKKEKADGIYGYLIENEIPIPVELITKILNRESLT